MLLGLNYPTRASVAVNRDRHTLQQTKIHHYLLCTVLISSTQNAFPQLKEQKAHTSTEGTWQLLEWKPDPQNVSDNQPFNLLHAGYLFVQLSGLLDHKEWCIGWISGCCLKHLTTWKKICASVSSVWMSTVPDIQDGQKIITNSSASISRTRVARKNTRIFDGHWLSCSFSVRMKNRFLFFLISGSETSFLINFFL